MACALRNASGTSSSKPSLYETTQQHLRGARDRIGQVNRRLNAGDRVDTDVATAVRAHGLRSADELRIVGIGDHEARGTETADVEGRGAGRARTQGKQQRYARTAHGKDAYLLQLIS